MGSPRWKVVLETWRLDRELARARHTEERALAGVGRGFRQTHALLSSTLPAAVGSAFARAAALEGRHQTLSARLGASLEADRQDYTDTASAWGRWLIVARGVLERLVLREEARRAQHELPAHLAELGALALGDPELAARIPAEQRSAVEEARAVLGRLERERTTLLEPYHGELVPRWLALLARELRTFSTFLWVELTKRFFLRLPALAAMTVAWWLTHAYTTSSFESNFRKATGHGRTGISEETMERLQFWLPILAAALVAYLSTHIAERVRRRYLLDRAKA